MFGGGNLSQGVINQGAGGFGGGAPSPKGSMSNASGKGNGSGGFVSGSNNPSGNSKQGTQHSPPHHKYQPQQPPPQAQYQHMQQVLQTFVNFCISFFFETFLTIDLFYVGDPTKWSTATSQHGNKSWINAAKVSSTHSEAIASTNSTLQPVC